MLKTSTSFLSPYSSKTISSVGSLSSMRDDVSNVDSDDASYSVAWNQDSKTDDVEQNFSSLGLSKKVDKSICLESSNDSYKSDTWIMDSSNQKSKIHQDCTSSTSSPTASQISKDDNYSMNFEESDDEEHKLFVADEQHEVINMLLKRLRQPLKSTDGKLLVEHAQHENLNSSTLAADNAASNNLLAILHSKQNAPKRRVNNCACGPTLVVPQAFMERARFNNCLTRARHFCAQSVHQPKQCRQCREKLKFFSTNDWLRCQCIRMRSQLTERKLAEADNAFNTNMVHVADLARRNQTVINEMFQISSSMEKIK